MAILNTQRTENQIIQDGKLRFEKNIGINANNASSTSLNILELTARELSNTWDTMNDLLKKNFLSTSYGAELDKIGELVQEPRNNAFRAMDLSTTNLKFYLNDTYASTITDLLTRYYTANDLTSMYDLGLIDDPNNPGMIQFPAGLTVYTQTGTFSYNTSNPIQLTNAQLFDYTPLIANGVGPSYNVGPNTLTSHDLVNRFPILSKIANALLVTNLYGIRNGSAVESDDNYRFRIANKAVSAVAGNNSAIRKAVLSVPGVVDMAYIPRSHGNGTFTIFPRTQEPIISDGIINAVTQSVASVQSTGSIAYVEVPTYLAISMKMDLRFAAGADKSSIFGGVRLRVMDYINNLVEGGEIVINEIIQRVMSVDEKIIDMNIPQFGFGEYERTTGIITNFTPLRLSNQIADWNERWFTNSSLCSICQAGVN